MAEYIERMDGDRPMDLAKGGPIAIERLVRFARALED